MKQMVWAVFLHGAEGWTIKKSNKNRIEALEMWFWRKNVGSFMAGAQDKQVYP